MTQTAEAPLATASRAEVKAFYAELLNAGIDLTAAELAERFERTDRWAREIRKEVSDERKAAAEATEDAGVPAAGPAPITQDAHVPADVETVPADVGDEAPASDVHTPENSAENSPNPVPETPSGPEPATWTDGVSENPPPIAQNTTQDATTADPRPFGHTQALAATEPHTATPSWTIPDPDPAPVAETSLKTTGTPTVPAADPSPTPPVRHRPRKLIRLFRGVPAERDRDPIATTGTAVPSADPAPETPAEDRKLATWPVWLLALPAFVAVWSGWVGLGELTGFGVVHPLPGIVDRLTLNTAITLPIGVETYAAYALHVWLSGRAPARARKFAMISALSSLVLGALGQVAYHLLEAAGITHAPWWITTVVAILPVAVLGMGAALVHLVHARD